MHRAATCRIALQQPSLQKGAERQSPGGNRTPASSRRPLSSRQKISLPRPAAYFRQAESGLGFAVEIVLSLALRSSMPGGKVFPVLSRAYLWTVTVVDHVSKTCWQGSPQVLLLSPCQDGREWQHRAISESPSFYFLLRHSVPHQRQEYAFACVDSGRTAPGRLGRAENTQAHPCLFPGSTAHGTVTRPDEQSGN